MSLQSELFRRDSRLVACLDNPLSHILEPDSGFHVGKIQAALWILDEVSLEADGKVPIGFRSEFDKNEFGPNTTSAVLAFKTRHKIINIRYQNSPDPIVGQMTIAFLDRELRKWEASENRVTVQINAPGGNANIAVGTSHHTPFQFSSQIQSWKTSWHAYRDLLSLTRLALLSEVNPSGAMEDPSQSEAGDCVYDTSSLFCFADKQKKDPLMVLWGFPTKPLPSYPGYSGPGVLNEPKNDLAQGPLTWEVLLRSRSGTTLFHSHIGPHKLIF
jgi:hypothetical protein